MVVAAALLVAPAYAGPDTSGGTGTTTSTADQSGSDASNSDTGDTYNNNVNGCHVVANSHFLGSYCPGGDHDGETIKQIMAGEEYHECWMERMSPELQEATSHYDEPPKLAYMEHCLRGIDPKTLKRTGPIYIVDTPKWLYPPYDHVEIGPNETTLLSFAQQSIPYPIAVASPTGQPRVGQWISFYDGQPDQMLADGSTHQVTVNTAGVTLTAVEERIVVRPRGLNINDKISCPGGGHKAEVGEKGVDGGNCWYRYQRSSAGQTNNQYPVRITAYWNVYMSGQAAPITSFTKSVSTRIPVTEIQSINVS